MTTFPTNHKIRGHGRRIHHHYTAEVGRVLTGFVEQARAAFANDLRAVVLYGSGAEGKLRATSDVNLLLVLSDFDQKNADQLREPLRLAQAAIRLRAMFLLESELYPAMEVDR